MTQTGLSSVRCEGSPLHRTKGRYRDLFGCPGYKFGDLGHHSLKVSDLNDLGLELLDRLLKGKERFLPIPKPRFLISQKRKALKCTVVSMEGKSYT